jgi:hypothetical protein
MRVLLTLLLSVLVLTGCNLDESTTSTPIPTPDIPVVEFVYPERGARVIEGAELKIDLVARDDTVGIRRIELYLNGQLLNTAEPPNAPVESVFRVEMNWFASVAATHVLSAIAYRPDGTRSDEAFLDIEVIAP